MESYSDRAISGASMLRPGIQALMEDAGRRRFDVVLAEAMDRLSRDQEDIAALFKRLRFAGVSIVTIAEGEINEMHIGLKGTMNALALKDLAQKTHRGLLGRVEAGLSAGGRAYGYDVVRRTDHKGEPIRGERAINEAEAAVVRRIFTMAAEGASPIAIAKTLNGAKIPGPNGRAWQDTTIRGHANRGTGILRNELYIGVQVWNRMHYIKDPATGKRVSRMNPTTEWVREEVPHLRIIDQDLWDCVQQRLAAVRIASGADKIDRAVFHERRRAKHILTGKLFCGTCGGSFGAVGKDYLSCAAARKQGTCDNRRGIRRSELESLILDALRHQLMQPEHVAEFVTEYTAEYNRLNSERSAALASHKRELESVTRKLDGLIDAIAEGMRAPGLQQKLDTLEARKAELTRLIETAGISLPLLHPNLAETYRERVTDLHAALTREDGGTAALEAVRALIERVDVSPPDGDDTRSLPKIVLTGAIAAMVGLALEPAAGTQKAARVGAGVCGLFASSVM
ncbi:recombinase family protein, partial [Acidiphilium sp. PM]|uniref:recombinase family protein n=1 Tax=Acidiphilium sp. PM TaxID=1043206 RepID=UPI001F52909D